jgi:triphosphoribosyl-dephospho-CoA synthase
MSSSVAQHAFLACLLEATARKPGNVHPDAEFDDLIYADFVRSAVAAAPAFENAVERGVGATVLDAIQRTQSAVARNTNLGIVLLVAPLACVPAEISLGKGIPDVLSSLGQRDAEEVYDAIRLANPGGLGRVDDQDLSDFPSVTLLEAMRLAADRDGVAAQYAFNFSTVFAGAKRLAQFEPFAARWTEAVVDLHVWLMAEFPDTLIARKCGADVVGESARRATAVLDAGGIETTAGKAKLAELDLWLRADGHRRNPGTTADLVAGCLFAALREGVVSPPPIPRCAEPFLDVGADACRAQ